MPFISHKFDNSTTLYVTTDTDDQCIFVAKQYTPEPDEAHTAALMVAEYDCDGRGWAFYSPERFAEQTYYGRDEAHAINAKELAEAMDAHNFDARKREYFAQTGYASVFYANRMSY